MSEESKPPTPQQLDRAVGLSGAALLGLGSILGTGVFVSLTIVADLAAEWTVLAILIAGVLAVCNGLSSAQLASAHPVSGGAYEYGYRYLNPAAGFTAGWMFLIAKSASAATAALGIAHYINAVLPADREVCPILTGVAIVIVMTAIVLGGLRRSTQLNAVLVSLTLIALGVFVVKTNPLLVGVATEPVSQSGENSITASATSFPFARFFEACALAFVAFTGYGRVATMGEEIRNPTRNIPLAVILTLALTVTLYVAVGWSLMSANSGARSLIEHPGIGNGTLQSLIAIGALLAMLGVLLNLILGLSRVLLAMARRGDVPRGLAVLNSAGTSPNRCVIAVGVLVAGLCGLGQVHVTWSLSAFTVLVYYATANLCALKQPQDERRYPPAISVVGCIACCSLAIWVEPFAWITGLALIAVGLIWHSFRQSRRDD
jgi:basic amino acid/polyamine antiporter, APA family